MVSSLHSAILYAWRWSNAATWRATLLRSKLKSVVARITTHLKHCHATKFRCCKLKQHVAASWTGDYLFQQFFSTCNSEIVFAWQCLRWVVIRATTLFNLQRNVKLKKNVSRITGPLDCPITVFWVANVFVFLRENPELKSKPGDITRLLSQNWKKLTKEEKSLYM